MFNDSDFFPTPTKEDRRDDNIKELLNSNLRIEKKLDELISLLEKFDNRGIYRR